ncbi:MAG TPA: hypothetical protein VIK91_27270, partial [Nannocystis sp.]
SDVVGAVVVDVVPLVSGVPLVGAPVVAAVVDPVPADVEPAVVPVVPASVSVPEGGVGLHASAAAPAAA